MAGGNKNIKPEDGRPFVKKDPRINKNGRPRKLIGTVNKELEEKGFTEANKQEITSCYLRLININEEELKAISNDKEQPILVKIVSNSILSDKGFDIIERLIDRGVGKSAQTTILEGGDKPITISFED